MQLTVVGGPVWRIIKLIQAFMDVLITCQNEEDPFKNEGNRVVKKISHCKSMKIFMTLKDSYLQSEIGST